MRGSRNNRKGFTLTEALVAMVVLTIAAGGIILPYSSGASVQLEGNRMALAAKLAHDMLEQIVSSDFEDIIETYNGYSEAQGQILDDEGGVFSDSVVMYVDESNDTVTVPSGSDYAKFSRNVSCQTAYIGDVEMVWVTVRVYYEGTLSVSLNTLIGDNKW